MTLPLLLALVLGALGLLERATPPDAASAGPALPIAADDTAAGALRAVGVAADETESHEAPSAVSAVPAATIGR